MQTTLDSVNPNTTFLNKTGSNRLHSYTDSIYAQCTQPFSTGKGDLDLVHLRLDQQEIQVLARLIANEHQTWDECAWMLAEMTLALEPALDLPQGRFWWGHLPNSVKLFPSYMYRIPRMDEVRQGAHAIARRYPSLKNLHHYLAQRFYLAHHIFTQ